MIGGAATTRGVDEINGVALFEEPGCPAFAAVGCIEKILEKVSTIV